MKLLVKTLKGEKFHVECEPAQTVLEVKGIIVSLFLLLLLVDCRLAGTGLECVVVPLACWV